MSSRVGCWGFLGLREARYWEWRGLCNKELYDLYPSPNVICEIKSRRMRLLDHVLVWETGVVHTGCWQGDLRERDHLENLGIDGRIIL